MIPSVIKITQERSRYVPASSEEPERRRVPRLSANGHTYVEDEHNRKVGVLGDISSGGLRIIPENHEAAQSFAAGKLMKLTLVGRDGSRTLIRAMVVYVNPFAIGLQFT
jgi:hypothetical protein